MHDCGLMQSGRNCEEPRNEEGMRVGIGLWMVMVSIGERR